MNSRRVGYAAASLALACNVTSCGSTEKNAAAAGGRAGTNPNPGAGGSMVSMGGVPNFSVGGFGGFTFSLGGALSQAECLGKHLSAPGITSECQSCMCMCNSSAAAACDLNCWELSRCVRASCASATDLSCISSSCGQYLSGAIAASLLTTCFSTCGTSCGEWFRAAQVGAGGSPASPNGGSAGSGSGAAGSANAGDDAGSANAGGSTSSGGVAVTSGAGGTKRN